METQRISPCPEVNKYFSCSPPPAKGRISLSASALTRRILSPKSLARTLRCAYSRERPSSSRAKSVRKRHHATRPIIADLWPRTSILDQVYSQGVGKWRMLRFLCKMQTELASGESRDRHRTYRYRELVSKDRAALLEYLVPREDNSI